MIERPNNQSITKLNHPQATQRQREREIERKRGRERGGKGDYIKGIKRFRVLDLMLYPETPEEVAL